MLKRFISARELVLPPEKAAGCWGSVVNSLFCGMEIGNRLLDEPTWAYLSSMGSRLQKLVLLDFRLEEL